MNFWQFLQQNWNELLTHVGEHLTLVLISTLIAVVIGIPTGILSAVKRNSFWDYAANVLGLSGQSVPATDATDSSDPSSPVGIDEKPHQTRSRIKRRRHRGGRG